MLFLFSWKLSQGIAKISSLFRSERIFRKITEGTHLTTIHLERLSTLFSWFGTTPSKQVNVEVTSKSRADTMRQRNISEI